MFKMKGQLTVDEDKLLQQVKEFQEWIEGTVITLATYTGRQIDITLSQQDSIVYNYFDNINAVSFVIDGNVLELNDFCELFECSHFDNVAVYLNCPLISFKLLLKDLNTLLETRDKSLLEYSTDKHHKGVIFAKMKSISDHVISEL